MPIINKKRAHVLKPLYGGLSVSIRESTTSDWTSWVFSHKDTEKIRKELNKAHKALERGKI